jgi:hypothetical protein
MPAKKVTIEKKDLPPLSPNGEYLIRYRVISEDKNRTSPWSPIYTLDAKPFIEDVLGGLQLSDTSLAITAIWEESPVASSYDVFVSFGIYNTGTSTFAWGSYAYHGSSLSQSYSFLRPSAATGIRVKIQLAGIEKVLSPALEICNIEDFVVSLS